MIFSSQILNESRLAEADCLLNFNRKYQVTTDALTVDAGAEESAARGDLPDVRLQIVQ